MQALKLISLNPVHFAFLNIKFLHPYFRPEAVQNLATRSPILKQRLYYPIIAWMGGFAGRRWMTERRLPLSNPQRH